MCMHIGMWCPNAIATSIARNQLARARRDLATFRSFLDFQSVIWWNLIWICLLICLFLVSITPKLTWHLLGNFLSQLSLFRFKWLVSSLLSLHWWVDITLRMAYGVLPCIAVLVTSRCKLDKVLSDSLIKRRNIPNLVALGSLVERLLQWNRCLFVLLLELSSHAIGLGLLHTLPRPWVENAWGNAIVKIIFGLLKLLSSLEGIQVVIFAFALFVFFVFLVCLFGFLSAALIGKVKGNLVLVRRLCQKLWSLDWLAYLRRSSWSVTLLLAIPFRFCRFDFLAAIQRVTLLVLIKLGSFEPRFELMRMLGVVIYLFSWLSQVDQVIFVSVLFGEGFSPE